MSTGFLFNNLHSADVGVYFRSVDRTLLPSKRITQYIVPGKSGTYDVEHGYENRDIRCEIGFTGHDLSRDGLREKAREVAQWLSAEGALVFDDEPDKEYRGKVVAGVGIEEAVATGKCVVIFRCEPFAYAREYSKAVVRGVELPHMMAINVGGTQENPCNIYIVAKDTVSGITITRRVLR